MKTSFFIAVFHFFSATIVSAQTTTATASISKPVPATVDRDKMLQLVNLVRRNGCQCGDTYYYATTPLAWNTLLETAAYKHTADMAKNKFFSHASPDGSRAGARLDRIGYSWKAYGENIGEGYKTEADMLKGWLASPGHCKNIMNKNFKEMGVARVGNIWTQEFGSR